MSTEPTYIKEYTLETAEDFEALRADEDFCDGAVSLIRYNGVPRQAYISYDQPRYYGLVARIGDRVSKDAAGTFYVNDKDKRTF